MCVKLSSILLLFPKSISKWISHPQAFFIIYTILVSLTVIINSQNYYSEEQDSMLRYSIDNQGEPQVSLEIININNLTRDQQTERINVSWTLSTDDRDHLTHYQIYLDCYDCEKKEPADFESEYPKNKTSIILPKDKGRKLELNSTYYLEIVFFFKNGSSRQKNINFSLSTPCDNLKGLNITDLIKIVDKTLELTKPDNIDECLNDRKWNGEVYFFIKYTLDKNKAKAVIKTDNVTLTPDKRIYKSLMDSDTVSFCVTLKSTHADSSPACKNVPKGTDILSILLITLAIVIVLIFICYVYCKRQRTDLRRALHRGGVWQPYHCPRSLCTMSEINPQYEYSQEIRNRGDADDYEIDYSRLTFGIEIGKGAFGRVFLVQVEATMDSPGFSKVAVKKLKKDASHDETAEFLTEISMLKRVGHHPNIVTLLGCCTIRQPYCMLMEFVPHGDLHTYLHKLRHYVETRRVVRYHQQQQPTTNQQQLTNQFQQQPINHTSNSDCSYITLPNTLPVCKRVSVTETEYTDISNESSPAETPTVKKQRAEEFEIDSKELQNFALQIAKGMAHLEEKQITHRDLAARNVLIDKNKVLKISDFGLSRTGIYINAKNKKVPLRWLSIEAIRDNLYSSKSDVWAFAVVLWEIATLGAFPYGILSNSELLPYLLDDKRLEKPDNLTAEIYSLMLRCWSSLPELRPSFSELVTILDSTGRNKIYVDFENIDSTYVFPPTEQQTLETIE